MRRRDFIKVIAGSATTWPLAAGAQQAGQPHNHAAQAIASVTADGAQRIIWCVFLVSVQLRPCYGPSAISPVAVTASRDEKMIGSEIVAR